MGNNYRDEHDVIFHGGGFYGRKKYREWNKVLQAGIHVVQRVPSIRQSKGTFPVHMDELPEGIFGRRGYLCHRSRGHAVFYYRIPHVV